jgi:hypothetical protein
LINRERRKLNVSKMTSIDWSWRVIQKLKQWTQSYWKCYLPHLHCLTPQNIFNILQTFHFQVIIQMCLVLNVSNVWGFTKNKEEGKKKCADGVRLKYLDGLWVCDRIWIFFMGLKMHKLLTFMDFNNILNK